MNFLLAQVKQYHFFFVANLQFLKMVSHDV